MDVTSRHDRQPEDKATTFDATYTVDEETRRKEGKARLIILIVIALLTTTYGAWNIWRMIEAVRSPVVSIKSATRPYIPVPGVAICGSTLDRPPLCYQSAFNAADDDYTLGASCNAYFTSHRMDATNFVNMRGFDNLTGQYCYILNPSQVVNGSYGANPLIFDNSTQKIALALWSNESANNTLGAITQDRWFFFGTFTESDDPTRTRFQIVKMPSISYIYFNRIEHYAAEKSDAIIGTGGESGSTAPRPGAKIEYDTTFTSFAIEGFAVDSHLWELLRIIPSNYVTDPVSETQKYPVQLWLDRIEFSLLQLAANMGGFVSILSAIYFILFGSHKINPWGIVQRYILKNVPPPPVYTPSTTQYSDVKVRPQDIETPATPSSSKSYRAGSETESIQPTEAHPQTPEHKLHREYVQRYSQGSIDLTAEMDDSKIQNIRHELRAEVQRTIANELAKLRLFLSKYYLKDIVKTE